MDTIAKAIAAGAFVLNGETIVLSPEGSVLDGQHRLRACVRAGREIQSAVVFGADPSLFHTYDQGLSRSAADNLHIAGVKDAKTAAGCAAQLVRLTFWAQSGSVTQMTVPKADVFKYARENGALCESAAALTHSFTGAGLRHPTMAACAMVFIVQTSPEVAEFAEAVRGGENLTKGAPAYMLRDLLLKTERGNRLRNERIAVATALCWNAYAEGRDLMRISPKMVDGRFHFPQIAKVDIQRRALIAAAGKPAGPD